MKHKYLDSYWNKCSVFVSFVMFYGAGLGLTLYNCIKILALLVGLAFYGFY